MNGASPLGLSLLNPTLHFHKVSSSHSEEVARLDVEDEGRLILGLAPLGRGEVAFEVFLGDLHAIHGVADSRAVEGAGRDAEILLALVHDDQREHSPFAPRERTDLATLARLNGGLDGGEVGVVDARAEDARGGLFQHDTLELLGGSRERAEADFHELTLAGVAGLHEGAGVVVVEVGGGGHMYFLVGWCRCDKGDYAHPKKKVKPIDQLF